MRLYRRYEEVTRWEQFVPQYFPDRPIPRQKTARAKLHKAVDATLLQDPAFQQLADQFQTKITLAGDVVEQAVPRQLPFQTVLMDSWFLSPELLEGLARHQKDWVSLILSSPLPMRSLTGSYAVLVTNRVAWTAKQILQRYVQRWPIETFYKDGKSAGCEPWVPKRSIPVF